MDGVGYAIHEYSLKRGGMFYRFPKEGSHWSRAVIKSLEPGRDKAGMVQGDRE